MVLAVWLIIKGFNPSATVLKAAETEPTADQASTFGTPAVNKEGYAYEGNG